MNEDVAHDYKVDVDDAIMIYIHEKDWVMLKGTQIDYKQEGLSYRLVFTGMQCINPAFKIPFRRLLSRSSSAKFIIQLKCIRIYIYFTQVE